MSPANIKTTLKNIAREEGFHAIGIAPANPVERTDYYRSWLKLGHAGEMDYLHRNAETRVDPAQLLPGAQSVAMFALNYHQPRPTASTNDPPQGKIAMYAWGRDYHRVVKRRIFKTLDRTRETLNIALEARVCVDTAPIMEREFAAAAGIGWIGKNTLVLNEQLGSYFFLGAAVLKEPLPPDATTEDHCGSCTECLDACPTDALHEAYRMNAARCISYLTIEHRSDIPRELAEKSENWVFGCDICQEVCPHNRKAPTTDVLDFTPRDPAPQPTLSEILEWTPDRYDKLFRGSAARRATLDMWKRNALIARANEKGESRNDQDSP